MNTDEKIKIIDKRIKIIMEKIEKISHNNEIPIKWERPLSEDKVIAFENKKGIKLPEDYRRFITTVASAGAPPFYGLFGIDSLESYSIEIEKPFIYTTKKHLDLSKLNLSDEDYDTMYESEILNPNFGFILLCEEFDLIHHILIVNTEDRDTYGTVWFRELANARGIFPIINKKNGKPMHFLDWLEYSVDTALEWTTDSVFFSYSELPIIFNE